MDWKNHKEEITAIIELIEDEHYPGRRNITDYLEQIFGYPEDMKAFVKSEYERIESSSPKREQ